MRPLLALAAVAIAASALLSPAHAGPRLDRIVESKTLRVGTPGDYRPFAITAGTGYEGHDIDVIEKIAKELNVTIQYVPTSWPNLVADLKADKFDVAVGGITRNVTRIRQFEMLPGYAPFGKVALVRTADAARYQSLADLDQANVRVIKNPGGTNETFVLANFRQAQVSTHPKNAEIPALIADGKGDVMITETYEALVYAKADPRLTAKFVDSPLTPKNYLGFMLPTDDADYTRVMRFAWDLVDQRGGLEQARQRWLNVGK
ncbi:transporter substrate-binding domain-containing protein [Aquincola tertiaricarbonis]|uniref:Transporter substrate-binding domain-containing protein n=1 Tax=Aquincola tertiaricarbonis TaxID=391953 RepID=A0ABY4SHY5_AQUTE|nr:transporter substrate-binding domain-containing protein [Aquincola tertiaricarbonis]URI11532.1 transporter substrate-binding domain-containing protein [Aquincola tertiaricarbonis]